MARLKGKDIAVYMADSDTGAFTRIALSTGCEVQVQCDMIEFSSFLSGRAKRTRPGRYSWSANVDALVADDDGCNTSLLEALKMGKRLYLSMCVAVPATTTHSVRGWACVAGWKEAAPLAGMATYSVSFQGDGELL